MNSLLQPRGTIKIMRGAVVTRSKSRRVHTAAAAGGASKKQMNSKSKVTKQSKRIIHDACVPWYHFFTKGDRIYNSYMSKEWSYEKRGDQALFEKLSLEGAQAGLSWRTILYKRDAYRSAFHGFDIEIVSRMTSSDIDDILNSGKTGNDAVVRHRGKLESIIHNAKQVLQMKHKVEGYTNFTDYLWSFVDDKPILNAWKERQDIPSKTEESEAMSKALKRFGFKFVGPTTCYSMMQSCGFVIDHPVSSNEWKASFERLQNRTGGFQDRR